MLFNMVLLFFGENGGEIHLFLPDSRLIYLYLYKI